MPIRRSVRTSRFFAADGVRYLTPEVRMAVHFAYGDTVEVRRIVDVRAQLQCMDSGDHISVCVIICEENQSYMDYLMWNRALGAQASSIRYAGSRAEEEIQVRAKKAEGP